MVEVVSCSHGNLVSHGMRVMHEHWVWVLGFTLIINSSPLSSSSLMTIYLPVCLSGCLSINVSLSVCLSLLVYLSICLSITLSIHLCLSVCLSLVMGKIRFSICFSVSVLKCVLRTQGRDICVVCVYDTP